MMLNKSLLEQYPDLVKEIKHQTERLEKLRSLQETNQDPETAASIADLAVLLIKNTANSIELARRIEAEVFAVDDARVREMLRLRYLDGLTWREIGEVFDISQERVQKVVKKYYSKNPS